MSVQNEQRLVQYIGNGVTTSFVIPFVFHSAAHVYVYVENITTGVVTPQILTTHYTLTGLSDDDGGSVNFIAVLTNNDRITIARVVPYEQLTDYVNNDRFNGDVHERQMDLIVMMIQQTADPSDLFGSKALKFPITEPASFGTVLPNANIRKGRILGFDNDTGEMVLFSQPLFTVTIEPPAEGTHVLVAVDGVMQWIGTHACE